MNRDRAQSSPPARRQTRDCSTHVPLGIMETKFIEPTVASRVKLTLCVAFGVALSLAMDRWWHPFMGFVKGLSTCESLPWLRGIVIAFVILSVLAGFSVSRAAVLTLRSGQSPFPGAWVWSRTKVRRGLKASIAGYGFGILALICVLGPVVAGCFLHVNVIFCWPVSCAC